VDSPKQQACQTARRLIAAGGSAALGVTDVEAGQPFVTFVSFAADAALGPLILISDLAYHSKCLKADPRASLLIADAVAEGDPMLTFRVTLQGSFAPEDSDAARACFLARHPYAEVYAGFGDFNIWRLQAVHAHIIAGFGRAYGVRYQDIAQP
jgi:hypothetical protein